MTRARRTGTNENISTYGSPSLDYDEGELSLWEAATDNNLITLNVSEVLECEDKGGFYLDNIVINNSITDVNHFRIIRPRTGHFHNGTSSTGVRFNSTERFVFVIEERYSQVQDIVARQDYDESYGTCFQISNLGGSSNGAKFSGFIGCIAFGGTGSSYKVGFAVISTVNTLSSRFFLIDCIAHDLDTGFSTDDFLDISSPNNIFIIYNCTAYNSSVYGFNIVGSLTRMRNCLGAASGTADFSPAIGFGRSGTPWTIVTPQNDYNASSDNTAPYVGVGSHGRQLQTFTFVNTGLDNYHLTLADAGARNFGEDLSADIYYAFTDDIDRQDFDTWDIGADEPEPKTFQGSPVYIDFFVPTPNFFLQNTDHSAPIVEFFVPAPNLTAPIFPCPALEGDFLGVDWLVEAPEIGLKWSYQYDPDGTWSHRILSISDIDTRVDPGGGIGTVGSVLIQAVEDLSQGSLMNLWTQYGRLEGVILTIKAIINPNNNPQTVTFFRGRIDRTEFQNGVAEISVTDDTLQGNVIIPVNVVTSAAYTGAPAESIGHALGIVYGLGSNIPALPLLNVSNERYIAAYHPFQSNGSGSIAIYDSVTGQPQSTVSGLSVSLTATPAQVLVSGRLPTFRFGLVSAINYGFYSVLDVTDAANIFDEISNTVVQIATSSFSVPLEGTGLLGVFASFGGAAGRNTIEISAEHFRRGPDSDTTVTGQFIVNVLNDDISTINRNLFNTIEYRHKSSPRDETFIVNNIAIASTENVAVDIKAVHEGGLGTVSQYFEIGELKIKMFFQANSDTLPIFVPGTANFAAKVDVDGGITGGAGTPIRNISDVIHDIMRNEIGIQIFDNDSFSSVKYSTRNSNWVFDGGIGFGWYQEQENSRDVIDTMARTAGVVVHNGFGGAWRIQALGELTGTDLHISQANIIFETPQGSAQEKSSSLKVVPGTIGIIFNNYEIRYRFNAATRNYDKVLFVNSISHNIDGIGTGTGVNGEALRQLCFNSVTRFGNLPPFIIESPWIGSDAMAENFINFLVRYFWTQRVFVNFRSLWYAWCLQLGNHITVDHPYLPSQLSGMNFEIHRKTLSPSQGSVYFEASSPFIVTFDYFRLVDSDGNPWYFWIDEDGNFVDGETSAPTNFALTAINIIDVSPSNLRYFIVNGLYLTNTQFFIITDVSGSITFDTSAPTLNGGEVSANRRPFLEMRSINGILYNVLVNDNTNLVIIRRP